MLKAAVDAPHRPNPSDLKKLFDISKRYVKECISNDKTENDWYNRITETATNWLSA